MEIVGHRTGKEKTVQEKSELLILPAKKRQEEERQGLKVEAGANDVGVGKGAVALAECGEDEDGVMLGDSGKVCESVDRCVYRSRETSIIAARNLPKTSERKPRRVCRKRSPEIRGCCGNGWLPWRGSH